MSNFIKSILRKKEPDFTSRRAVPRYDLVPLNRVYFRLHDLGEKVLVNTLSVSGVGLVNNENVPWPPQGSTMEGKLYIDDVSYKISLYLVYNNDSGIGTQIVEYDKGLETALRKYALNSAPEGKPVT